MGFLSRLFGQKKKVVASLPGPGEFGVDVVGESKYQDALESICGGRKPKSQSKDAVATLVHEDTNPYDEKAVRVDIDGRVVGYLSRENARQYREKLQKAGYPGITATCAALIVGGWDDGKGSRGHFGVKLDLPTG